MENKNYYMKIQIKVQIYQIITKKLKIIIMLRILLKLLWIMMPRIICLLKKKKNILM